MQSPSITTTETRPVTSLTSNPGAQTPIAASGAVQSPSRLSVPVLDPAPAPLETIAKSKNARRRKKRAAKNANGAPSASTVIRGFETPTSSSRSGSPNVSGASTPRLQSLRKPSPCTRGAGSPAIRPSGLARAITELKLQGDSSDSETPGRGRQPGSPLSESHFSRSSERSESDDSTKEKEKEETYDVPIQSDYASTETHRPNKLFSAVEGGLRTDSPHRKMTSTDFEPLKCLGKGTYGTVLLVKQHSTGRLFAQKQLKKATVTVHKRLIEQTKSERAILESVNRHPFVVKLFYAFQDHSKLYLILEYAQGGELFHHLSMERMFSEEVSAFYMAEMVLALDHLHRHLGVIYRDLKPENCLLDSEGHLLLTDFGLSKVAVASDNSGGSEDSKCTSFNGTIDYMAPEVIQGKPYDAAVDYWSLGALGYDLLTGSPPFSSANWTKTQQKIVHGGKIAMPYYLGPDSKDLLLRLLKREPRKRLGGNMPKDMDKIKSHRFFRRVDWKALEKRECEAPIQPIVTDPEAAENFGDEFTGLAMSPVEHRKGGLAWMAGKDGIERQRGIDGFDGSTARSEDPFGGFSFVASRSLLEAGMLE